MVIIKVIGFTGTSHGMILLQKANLKILLTTLKTESSEFHHGDCIGADEEARDIAFELGYEIHRHPPTNSSKRAFTEFHVDYPEKSYLIRNQDIVIACHALIACPVENNEILRSGTWSTVRKAKKVNKELFLLTPDVDLTIC